jgi:hypothetical protein
VSNFHSEFNCTIIACQQKSHKLIHIWASKHWSMQFFCVFFVFEMHFIHDVHEPLLFIYSCSKKWCRRCYHIGNYSSVMAAMIWIGHLLQIIFFQIKKQPSVDCSSAIKCKLTWLRIIFCNVSISIFEDIYAYNYFFKTVTQNFGEQSNLHNVYY